MSRGRSYRDAMSAVLFADPGSADWVGVGLVLAIVGGFLLANSILFRHPRGLVEEHFGAPRKRLASVREYIFHRLQVHLGFLFLLAGFGLQLYGRYQGQAAEARPQSFPTAWVGIVLLAVVALEVLGWWASHRLFRRHLRRHFRAHPPDLESDVRLARELGELFGIQSAGDDSVPAYLARIRREIGLSRERVLQPTRPTPEEILGGETETEELV